METGISYYANRILKHVAEDMAEIKKNNCTYVVHTFSEEDLHFYKDTMKEIVKVTHDHGLAVHLDPWAVGGLFGGEAFSKFVMENKDACQVDNQGHILGRACPNHSGFREYLRSWTEEALGAGPDYIFWDEPHYPMFPEKEGRWTCCCAVCRKKYGERFGREMGKSLEQEMVQFYQDSVMELLDELCITVRKAGVKNSVCFLPRERFNPATYDWEKYARLSSIDMIGTDPYWTSLKEPLEECVPRLSRRIRELCLKHGKEGQIWIQNIGIRLGTETDISRAIDLAYQEGIRNMAAWCYHGASMLGRSVRCDDPEKVWKILGNKYKELLLIK
ncbi:MAG: hypothetical protein PHF84_12890 [bacterium]|nr:hypothetical protein [bacterium]